MLESPDYFFSVREIGRLRQTTRTPRPAHAPPALSNKMASFSVGQCVDLQFTPDPWSVRITIAWCACTPPWSAKTCRGKFRV